MMFFDPVRGQWFPVSAVPTPIPVVIVIPVNTVFIDPFTEVLQPGANEPAMVTRLSVTILADGTRDGGTQRAECVQAAEMLARVGEHLVNTGALTGTIVDRNGVATATYAYTPTATS